MLRMGKTCLQSYNKQSRNIFKHFIKMQHFYYFVLGRKILSLPAEKNITSKSEHFIIARNFKVFWLQAKLLVHPVA